MIQGRRSIPLLRAAALVFLPFMAACAGGEAPPPASPTAEAPPPVVGAPMLQASAAPAPSPAPEAGAKLAPAGPAALSAPIDEEAVADATGVEKPETSADGVVKASFPRKDVDVAVGGWKLTPFMGLTSWVAFAPRRKGMADAMIMGDLVLFEDEVNPVMSELLDHGLQVTALHNHFFYDVPHVYFMHVGGEGTVAALGGGVRVAMQKIAEIRKRAPKPGHTFGDRALPAKSSIDAAKVEAALGAKGQVKDGMFKASMGRSAVASCGCNIGKTLGVSTWAAFGGSDDNAVVDGDFAVTEGELQPVLKALRASGINVVAIHHHMSGETPRILFLHYWGRGKATDLATAVKKALDLTAWDEPKAQTT